LKQVFEKELKLSVPDNFTLPELPGQPIVPRRFTSTYFDTQDFRLANASITLRRRVENQKGLWQLKLPKQDGRLEIEEPGGPSGPPPSIASLLFGVLSGNALGPIAKIRTTRDGLVAENDGIKLAEVVIDKFQVIREKSVVAAFQEIEIELLEGSHSDLMDLDLVLRHAGAKQGDGRPKVFQALGLQPVKVPKASRKASDLEHVQAAISDQFNRIVRHDPGTRLGTDPEDLHQLRVAVRRLRSFLAAAAPLLEPAWTKALRTELEWAGDFLSPVRDLDVMIPYFERELCLLDPTDAAVLEPFLAQIQDERERARQSMLDDLRSERYLSLLATLESATKSITVRPAAGQSLRTVARAHFRYLRKAVLGLDQEPTDEQLHRIRIFTKRARFAGELLAGKAGKALAALVERAKQVQDVLGEHQDAVVAEVKIHAFAAQFDDAESAFASGRLAERQLQRKMAARDDFPAAWQALARKEKKAWR